MYTCSERYNKHKKWETDISPLSAFKTMYNFIEHTIFYYGNSEWS
jgi:hypothetical protein